MLLLHGWAAEAADPRAVFARASPSVLVLEISGEAGGRLGQHTALVVGAERAVSVCDILDGAGGMTVRAGDAGLRASVRARDAGRNLCLLDVPGLAAPEVARGADDTLPATGERVFAVSNALGLGVGISDGVVAGIRRFGAEHYIQFSAPISPGSEGGALVDAKGRLLGVIDYRQRDGQNVNFAAPARWIAEIEGRQTADDGRRQWRERATRLERERNGGALLALAQEWSAAYPDDGEAWRWLAAGAQLQADLAIEERAWRELRRLDPALVGAGVGLARVLLRRGQPGEALALARSLLALRQEDADVWIAIGQAELALNNNDGAEQALRKAVSLHPWAAGAHEGLIAVAQRRGDAAAERATWSRMVQLNPESAHMQLRLVDAYLREGRPARAFPLVERLLEREPRNGDAWIWKGAVLNALQRPAEATVALRHGLERAPLNPAWAWGSLGAAYLELKRFPEAIEAYREAQRLAPDEFHFRFWLAVALKDGGRVEEAIALDEALARERPDDASVWRQLGFARAVAGQFAPSAQALERSLTLAPAQGKVWVALMETYHALGRQEDLRRAYDKLRGIDARWAQTAYRTLILPYEEGR
jgi:tetratricopeptide (TPR) repeat protein